jgi:2-methylcitrate dehydratase PrpD
MLPTRSRYKQQAPATSTAAADAAQQGSAAANPPRKVSVSKPSEIAVDGEDFVQKKLKKKTKSEQAKKVQKKLAPYTGKRPLLRLCMRCHSTC